MILRVYKNILSGDIKNMTFSFVCGYLLIREIHIRDILLITNKYDRVKTVEQSQTTSHQTCGNAHTFCCCKCYTKISSLLSRCQRLVWYPIRNVSMKQCTQSHPVIPGRRKIGDIDVAVTCCSFLTPFQQGISSGTTVRVEGIQRIAMFSYCTFIRVVFRFNGIQWIFSKIELNNDYDVPYLYTQASQ